MPLRKPTSSPPNTGASLPVARPWLPLGEARTALLRTTALSLLTISACSPPKPETILVPVSVMQPVHLPDPSLIVPAAAPRPALEAGADARLLARLALSYGDLNAERLAQARRAYRAVLDTYQEKDGDRHARRPQRP